MATKFTADKAGIVSVSRPVARKVVTVDNGIASRSLPKAETDGKPDAYGILSAPGAA